MNGPPKVKRAVPGRTARAYQTTQGTNDSASAEHGQGVAVRCVKHDGTRYLFQRYPTLEEAEAVAKTLRSVGCEADVQQGQS